MFTQKPRLRNSLQDSTPAVNVPAVRTKLTRVNLTNDLPSSWLVFAMVLGVGAGCSKQAPEKPVPVAAVPSRPGATTEATDSDARKGSLFASIVLGANNVS